MLNDGVQGIRISCHSFIFSHTPLKSGGHLNIKMSSYRYRDSYVKDKTVSRPSYLQHGNPHISERQTWYWDRALCSLNTTSCSFCSDFQWSCVLETEWPESAADVLLSYSWWRHQTETFSALLAICAGNSPVPVNFLHKGRGRGALMLSLIWARINGWVNNREAGDLSRHHVHYDVIVMYAE